MIALGDIMKVAIIEDEKVHKDLLANYLEKWSKEKNVKLSAKSFPSAESFLFEWEENKEFDILFVDIQMKEINGMEMAKKVRQSDRDINIVFTTGIPDYLEEGYEVEALYYLMKPINEEKVKKCMDKVLLRKKPEQYLLVHSKEETYKLQLENINYIEARGHASVIDVVLDSGKSQAIEILESLSELEKSLDDKNFIKCHRSYICNIINIHHIDKINIYFDSGSFIPVSRRLYTSVNQAFIRYFRKMQV